MKDRRLLNRAVFLLFGVLPLFCGCGRRYTERIAVPYGLESDAAGDGFAGGSPAGDGAAGAAAPGEGADASAAGGNGASPGKEAAAPTVWVDVSGAVRRPGVFELPQGARVYQALAAAGGLTEDAAPWMLNQARVISDGEQIYVPDREAAEGAEVPGLSPDRSSSGKININTASAEELTSLKGIGAARASDIIAYRERCGGFSSIEEIMQVSGIKTSLFEGIRDRITVG